MKILVFNTWSSSLKYQLFDMGNNDVLAKWLVDRIWVSGSILKHKDHNNQKKDIEVEIPNHKEALKMVLNVLIDEEIGVIKWLDAISAVGHRVVHGWEEFSKSVVVTHEIKEKLKGLIPLAPLHNPANIMWIESVEEILPGIPNIAVFDTAFHQTISKNKYIYPIPYQYYEKYKIRKYGFHGTSHKYVFNRYCNILGIKKKNNNKIISCHIWNWISITAIKNSKVFDTSMGFTPLEWVMMWTRSWDIDPSIVWFLIRNERIDIDKVDKILNTESWLIWVSQRSGDMRDVLASGDNWDDNSKMALAMYIDRIIKYIAYYITCMNWIDAIIFAWWVWENSPKIRSLIIKKLKYFKIKLNSKNIHTIWEEWIISNNSSRIKVLVIPTNEELYIAKETFNIIKKNAK